MNRIDESKISNTKFEISNSGFVFSDGINYRLLKCFKRILLGGELEPGRTVVIEVLGSFSFLYKINIQNKNKPKSKFIYTFFK